MRSRRVLIVGGGSAGWMAAAYLEAALRNDPRAQASRSRWSSRRTSRGSASARPPCPASRHVLSVIGVNPRRVHARRRRHVQAVDQARQLAAQGVATRITIPFCRDAYTQSVDRTGLEWLTERPLDSLSSRPSRRSRRLCHLGHGARSCSVNGTSDLPLAYAFHLNAQKFADLSARRRDRARRGRTCSMT
jgi:tryptophan 7-halogenase